MKIKKILEEKPNYDYSIIQDKIMEIVIESHIGSWGVPFLGFGNKIVCERIGMTVGRERTFIFSDQFYDYYVIYKGHRFDFPDNFAKELFDKLNKARSTYVSINGEHVKYHKMLKVLDLRKKNESSTAGSPRN